MDPAKNVLVTGANGMIGSRLTEHLLARNFRVSHLVRSPQNEGGIPTFRWDPDKKYMDGHALQNVDAIIHLAGAGIADKRWSARRKMEIMESRTRSGQLIFDALKERGGNVSVVISASGTSYYGLKDPGRPFVETDPPGDDFMAGVTVAWENQADAFGQLGLRVVKIRTGPALSPDSIALRRISLPVKLIEAASLRSG